MGMQTGTKYSTFTKLVFAKRQPTPFGSIRRSCLGSNKGLSLQVPSLLPTTMLGDAPIALSVRNWKVAGGCRRHPVSNIKLKNPEKFQLFIGKKIAIIAKPSIIYDTKCYSLLNCSPIASLFLLRIKNNTESDWQKRYIKRPGTRMLCQPRYFQRWHHNFYLFLPALNVTYKSTAKPGGQLLYLTVE